MSLADHGFTPTAIAARLTYTSAPESLQGAVAAGLLGGGSRFLGVTEDAARFLSDGLAGQSPRPEDEAGWDELAAARRRRERRRPAGSSPGSGTRSTRSRTRARRCCSSSPGATARFGDHLELFAAIGRVHPEILGRTLPLNGAGACGAVLADLDLPRVGHAGLSPCWPGAPGSSATSPRSRPIRSAWTSTWASTATSTIGPVAHNRSIACPLCGSLTACRTRCRRERGNEGEHMAAPTVTTTRASEPSTEPATGSDRRAPPPGGTTGSNQHRVGAAALVGVIATQISTYFGYVFPAIGLPTLPWPLFNGILGAPAEEFGTGSSLLRRPVAPLRERHRLHDPLRGAGAAVMPFRNTHGGNVLKGLLYSVVLTIISLGVLVPYAYVPKQGYGLLHLLRARRLEAAGGRAPVAPDLGLLPRHAVPAPGDQEGVARAPEFRGVSSAGQVPVGERPDPIRPTPPGPFPAAFARARERRTPARR